MMFSRYFTIFLLSSMQYYCHPSAANIVKLVSKLKRLGIFRFTEQRWAASLSLPNYCWPEMKWKLKKIIVIMEIEIEWWNTTCVTLSTVCTSDFEIVSITFIGFRPICRSKVQFHTRIKWNKNSMMMQNKMFCLVIQITQFVEWSFRIIKIWTKNCMFCWF